MSLAEKPLSPAREPTKSIVLLAFEIMPIDPPAYDRARNGRATALPTGCDRPGRRSVGQQPPQPVRPRRGGTPTPFRVMESRTVRAFTPTCAPPSSRRGRTRKVDHCGSRRLLRAWRGVASELYFVDATIYETFLQRVGTMTVGGVSFPLRARRGVCHAKASRTAYADRS